MIKLTDADIKRLDRITAKLGQQDAYFVSATAHALDGEIERLQSLVTRLEAERDAARAKALEEAALIVEQSMQFQITGRPQFSNAIADKIRSLTQGPGK